MSVPGDSHHRLQELLVWGEAAVPSGETEARGWCGAPVTRVPSVSPQTLRWCQGWVFLEQQQPVVELSCQWVPPTVRKSPKRHRVPSGGHPDPAMSPGCDTAPCPPQVGRIRPSPLRDLLPRIRDQLRNIIPCGNIWIRDKLNLQPPKP